jgi:iron complex outermembrane receptor protein
MDGFMGLGFRTVSRPADGGAHRRGVTTLAGTLIALGLAPGPVAAQEVPVTGTIAGVVVDSASGRPIATAAVQVLELHRLETTHREGQFAFRNVPPGNYTVVGEQLGYGAATRSVTVRAGEVAQVRLALQVAPLQHDEIVVTGTLSARSGQDLLSPVSVVSGAEMERRMEGTVAATLQSEPGVSLASIGPATARPVIRGLGGDRILILEDGVRPGDMSSTSSDHAVAIEPLTAKQFEVVRGPMSLLYGSSALGGVVNVVREEIPTSRPEDTHGVLTAQVTSVNRGGAAGGYVNGAIGGIAARAEASARFSGDVHTPDGVLINTDARTWNVSGGAAGIGTWGHAGASYRYYHNDYGIPGGFIGGHDHGVDIEMRRHTVRGQMELHPGEGKLFSTLEANGLFTKYDHVELEESGSVGTRFAQKLFSGEAIARHGAGGPLAEGAIGFRGQYRDITTGGSLRTPSTYDYTLAGFIIEELGTGALRAQLGARWDWARSVPRDTSAFINVGGERVPVRERSFGSLSGSFGLLYRLHDDVRLGASVSRAYRTPDFNELYSDGPHLAANSYDVGDPSLEEETGIGVDLFARVTRERISAELAGFANQLSNYVFPSSRGRAEQGSQGLRPRFQYTNEDARFTGVEGELEWSLHPHWVLNGTASYVRAKFTSDRAPIPILDDAGMPVLDDTGNPTFVPASKYPPMIPPLNGRAGVRYEFPGYFGGADVRWAADQDRLGDFEDPTAAYAVADISAGVRFLRGGRFHTMTLRIDNVFDTAYRQHLSRIKGIMPEPGRNISLLYRLRF